MFTPVRFVLAACAFAACFPAVVSAGEISGEYLEVRNCDVYTGPCFANAEVGLTGKQAVMAWHIEQGRHNNVDLSGMKVVVSVSAADTLGFGGGVVFNPDPIKSVVLVDERASSAQRDALVDFVRARAGRVVGEIVRVGSVGIDMQIDHVSMVGKLKAGNEVSILTRQLVKTDCTCSNEINFYPPLAKVDNAAAAYTLEGGFGGAGLGVRWSAPHARSAFLATFDY